MRTFDYDDGLLAAAGLHPRAAARARTSPARCSARSRPTSPTSWTSRTTCPSWRASATASPPGSAPASSSPARPTSTWAPASSPAPTRRPTRPAWSSASCPAPCRGPTSSRRFIGGGTYNISWFVEKFSGVDPMALGLGLSAEQVLETAAAQLPPGADGLLVAALLGRGAHPVLGLQRPRRGARADRRARQGARLPCAAGGPGVRAAAAHRRGRGVAGEADRAARHRSAAARAARCGARSSPTSCAVRCTSPARPRAPASARACSPRPPSGCTRPCGRPSRRCPAPAPCTGRTRTGRRTYDGLFGVYRQLYPRLRDVFAELADLAGVQP